MQYRCQLQITNKFSKKKKKNMAEHWVLKDKENVK